MVRSVTLTVPHSKAADIVRDLDAEDTTYGLSIVQGQKSSIIRT